MSKQTTRGTEKTFTDLQKSILCMLEANPRQSAAQLAEKLKRDPSYLRRTLNELEKKKAVHSVKGPGRSGGRRTRYFALPFHSITVPPTMGDQILHMLESMPWVSAIELGEKLDFHQVSIYKKLRELENKKAVISVEGPKGIRLFALSSEPLEGAPITKLLRKQPSAYERALLILLQLYKSGNSWVEASKVNGISNPMFDYLLAEKLVRKTIHNSLSYYKLTIPLGVDEAVRIKQLWHSTKRDGT
ncbi:winged helix-turn-helix domain-containing protein [Shimazuella sp. AN120528]|uniref:winged helix-turn-helix domain-containing protein n=1 Tax=Shimazuella soli TaxID=1892854 RepID=UPI001F0F2B87|nr:winged helix-turn-helix domain-containing protein [Shimazuella soli]MCH5583999.1 winged helix-turn-helix domain-containing protein [Shimazuella soli]